MAHFYSTIQGNRGEASRLGSAKSGMIVNCSGWNSEIKINASVIDGKDQFKVYKTSGSGNLEPDVLIYHWSE